jgi:hypothetical protein
MRKNLAFAFFVICLFSCNERLEENKKNKQTNLSGISTHDVYFEKFLNIVETDSLKGKIRREGDTIAFQKLKEIYYNSGYENEFFYYSMFMANTYEYSYAFYTSYSILMTDIITEKNKVNNIYANYYLLKSYELGYKGALSAIEERFGKSAKITSSKDYLNNNFEILFGKN